MKLNPEVFRKAATLLLPDSLYADLQEWFCCPAIWHATVELGEDYSSHRTYFQSLMTCHTRYPVCWWGEQRTLEQQSARFIALSLAAEVLEGEQHEQS